MQDGRVGGVERWLLGAAMLWIVLGGCVFGPTDSTYKILYGAVLGYLLGFVGGRACPGTCPPIIEEEP
jgi:hypothetical protein